MPRKKYVTEDDRNYPVIIGPYEDADDTNDIEQWYLAHGGPFWRPPWTYL